MERRKYTKRVFGDSLTTETSRLIERASNQIRLSVRLTRRATRLHPCVVLCCVRWWCGQRPVCHTLSLPIDLLPHPRHDAHTPTPTRTHNTDLFSCVRLRPSPRPGHTPRAASPAFRLPIYAQPLSPASPLLRLSLPLCHLFFPRHDAPCRPECPRGYSYYSCPGPLPGDQQHWYVSLRESVYEVVRDLVVCV